MQWGSTASRWVVLLAVGSNQLSAPQPFKPLPAGNFRQQITAMSGLARFLSYLLFAASLWAGSPVIFWIDANSGPTAGGEDNHGMYMTIGGNNFGPNQGSSNVKINGSEVAQYIGWSNAKISVQPGNVTTGPVTVTVGGSTAMGPAFTARPGNIYFIGSTLDNTPAGSCPAMKASNSYTSPWGMTNAPSQQTEGTSSASNYRTPYTYYNCLSPGDTLVFLDGASYLMYDGRGWHAALTFDKVATSAAPITIMARPGWVTQPRLGAVNCTDQSPSWNAGYGIRAVGGAIYHNVYGMSLTVSYGNGGSLAMEKYRRAINNLIQCSTCSSPSAALGVGGGDSGFTSELLGNVLTNISTSLDSGSGKTYHSIYENDNYLEVAWNYLHGNASTTGFSSTTTELPGSTTSRFTTTIFPTSTDRASI